MMKRTSAVILLLICVCFAYAVEQKVQINGKMYFQEGGTGNSFISASLGTVQIGELVTFSGRNFHVKDVKIVGEAGSSNQSGTEDSSGHQWDF